MNQKTPSAQSASDATRRQFLRRATAGAGAVLAAPWAVGAGERPVVGANERIGVGFIGCGGRSGAHFGMVRHLRDAEKMPLDLVAACDVYRPRLERRCKEFGVLNAYSNHRELLADEAVDLVCIATPDHHHGYQAVDAIQAGKDVYCEKPVTHWRQFELTKKLAEVVAKGDRVFQLGTQGMSDSAWHQMKQLVADGLIGQPVFGETSFFRLGDWGERGMPVDDRNAKPGKDLDWDAFLGDRPKRPFDADRFFRWRLFEDYAGGPVTDVYPHCLTQVVDILGVGFPDLVVGTAGIHRYSYRLREVPDTANLLAQYPENVTISLLGTWANDFNSSDGHRGAGARMPYIRGWDGTLAIDRNNRQIVFIPVRIKGAKPPQRFPIQRGENNLELWKNLLACCRDRTQTPWSPMDLAFRTQTVLQMAALSAREGKVARFDHEKQQIVLS